VTADHAAPEAAGKTPWIGASLTLLLVAGLAGAVWLGWGRPAVRSARLLVEARASRSRGSDVEAERLAAAALALDPSSGPAALLAAECAAALHEPARAIQYLRDATSADATFQLAAHLLAARLDHRRLYRFSEAEREYRAALELDPENVEANTGLAQLLGLCGRRAEAIAPVLRLVLRAEPTDLLILLARENGAVNDQAALDAARRAAPEDPNPLVGGSWRAASSDETSRAIDLLREALRLAPEFPAAHAALGVQLLAARRFDELIPWNEHLPPAADDFGPTWRVRAALAEHAGDSQGAIRCYWESIRRNPESKGASARLASLLGRTGKPEAAEKFAAQVRRLRALEELQDRVLFSSGGLEIDSLLDLAGACEAAGRQWEAYGWLQAALRLRPDFQPAALERERLQRLTASLPLKLTADSANLALQVDLSSYPLPKFDPAQRPHDPTQSPAGNRSTLTFRDDAAAAGLVFRYMNGTLGSPSRRMYEFTGGGIGVLDFDVDGFADVYLTQGCPWPPGQPARGSGDRLFRNRSGVNYDDVTIAAGIEPGGFGQGIAVGDFNADGFPDVYAAQIRANRLWLNNGDGTFDDVTPVAGVAGSEWTTSCLMADLNRDGLPDLYAVNYVMADDVFDRVCRAADGAPRMCMPFDFDAQPDRLWLNDGNGRFTEATAAVLSPPPAGKGLGVAVWDAHGNGALSLLVANDTTPSFLYEWEPSPDGRPLLRDRAFEAGLAVNGDGKATGCMGIALGDVNDDGRLDVHITNFLAESNTLYLSAPDGGYDDRTREAGLRSATINVLGFGTQFLDADLDGRLELFNANGHIDDLRSTGRPYRMPPMLFRQTHAQFQRVSQAELGPYFEQEWLGRSAVRLDWNRDGREDLLVGHLGDQYALLTNTSPNAGQFLSLKLIGIQSNRDAIGTILKARMGDRTIVRQVTAGDGYQASNERRVIFGLGSALQVDELVVRWPSGTVQTLTGVAASRELWIREGQPPVAIRSEPEDP
jgi:tetratricopeptide (TPR) repeat protein